VDLPEIPKAEAWEALPLTDEQKRNNTAVIPPEFRPRVVLRYADTKDLFVSGLLDGASEIAQHPAVVDVPVDRGHVVLFSNNPMWRGETQGSYFLIYNAILNFDRLNAGPHENIYATLLKTVAIPKAFLPATALIGRPCEPFSSRGSELWSHFSEVSSRSWRSDTSRRRQRRSPLRQDGSNVRSGVGRDGRVDGLPEFSPDAAQFVELMARDCGFCRGSGAREGRVDGDSLP